MTTYPNKPESPDFDDVVIGSSPLMLLQAGLLARQGRRVCLVERADRLGGSWQTARLDNGEDVEIACHLIEVFPGAYELLEGASGVAFVPLDLQPIRVHRSGWIVPYFSRVVMLASGARLVWGLCRAQLQAWLGRGESNRLINFQTKLSSYVHHQVPAFFQAPVMQGPASGFVHFMDRLVARTRADGVQILQRDIADIARKPDGRWCLRDTAGATLVAQYVHCTTSTNLAKAGPDHFRARPPHLVHRLCVLVDVPRDQVRHAQSYVAFWNDPLVARIARIDMPRPRADLRYLVEFHRIEDADACDLPGTARRYLQKARILGTDGAFAVIGRVDCAFTANVDQLPAGEIAPGFHGYYSMGNLAAGLSGWRKTARIPPLPDAARHNSKAHEPT